MLYGFRCSVCWSNYLLFCFFFFNDTATTEIYTLSLHDALPIYSNWAASGGGPSICAGAMPRASSAWAVPGPDRKSTTSELQSPCNLVCRLLLEKKKRQTRPTPPRTVIDLSTSRAHVLTYYLCVS